MPTPYPSMAAPLRTRMVAGAARAVRLAELEGVVPGAQHRGDAVVMGVTLDSRRVVPGDLFLAARGQHVDGHTFAADAQRNGAAALVVEEFLALPLPQLRVPSVAQAAGPIASAMYGPLYERLPLAGVTGTNGKTTTCHLVRACLGTMGAAGGQIGTTGMHFGDRVVSFSNLTTPEAPELQVHLAAMGVAGLSGAAVEVSSHGLARHRADGVHFDVAVFLGLEPEHLDYHGTMENYFAAKCRLFEAVRCREAIVCVDDEWGLRLARSCPVPVTTFGHTTEADVPIEVASKGLGGISVQLRVEGEDVVLDSPLVGRVNGSNIAAAYLASRALGVTPSGAKKAFARCPAPPGRFEVLTTDEPFLVVVDYAHTPEALAMLVDTARGLAAGEVRIVLGARGGRYQGKRAEMARVAALAERVTVTTDNAGDEDPAAIIDQMMAGIPSERRDGVEVEPDRATAILKSVEALGAGDVLLITGRGDERMQRFGEHVVALDDRVAARLALGARGARGDRGDRDDPRRTVGAVIPAKDAEATLEGAIRALLNQTAPLDEVIVVDDGSTDRTVDVVQRFGARVRLIQQPRLGPAAARNAGIAASAAEWIAFCDADDEWHPQKLAIQLASLEKDADCVLCATDWARPGVGTAPVEPRPEERLISTGELLVLNRFQTSTVIARRDALCRIGGFTPSLDGGEDWDCWIRLSRLGSVRRLVSPLVIYRDNPSGVSKELGRLYRAAMRIAERELVDGVPRAREIRAWHHLRFAVAFLRLGERGAARACLADLADQHLLAASVPATVRLLAPFLLHRARARGAQSKRFGSGVAERRVRRLATMLTTTRARRGLERYKPFDLQGIAHEVLMARRRDAERAGLQVAAELNRAPMSGDPSLVGALVTSLVDNAIRHNVRDGRVEVVTETTDDRAVLRVRNSGSAVPQDVVDRLFEPNHNGSRAGSVARRKDRGDAGLGLRLVRAVAASQRAMVKGWAYPTGGLEIEVSFPLDRDDSQIDRAWSQIFYATSAGTKL